MIIRDQSSNIVVAPDSTPQITREPIYDTELNDKNSTIDLSRNVAYVKWIFPNNLIFI